MHAVNDGWAHVDAGRDLASRIAGARFVEFPGKHFFFHNDTIVDAVASEIEEFVTGARRIPSNDRALATVLFTDIVGSTERLVSVGDRAWRELVASHHDIIRAELDVYRGREVDNAGDGFFATFDGPGRAVACARSVIDRLSPVGLDIRAGVHTGECEVVNNKVGGIAVHVGARIAALAGPREVLVSSTVKDLTAGSGIIFEDYGERSLKGIPQQWHLYRVLAVPDRNA
jgi:class 3 adenylate cyclase